MVYRIIRPRPENNVFELTYSASSLQAVQNTSNRFAVGTPGWIQSSVADGGSLMLPIPALPKKGRLLQASATVLGIPGHVGMPASKPAVLLTSILPPIGGASVLGGFVLDPSTTLAQYEVAHEIVIPDLDFDLSSEFELLEFEFAGESGANAIIGLRLFKFTLTIAE